MKAFARALLACAAAGMFAPDASAQCCEGPTMPGIQAGGWHQVPEPEPNNTYTRTTQAPGATKHALLSYLVMAGVFGAIFAAVFIRDTRQTFAPRQRRPWDE